MLEMLSSTGDSMTITQSRRLFSSAVLLVVSCTRSAQSQSEAELSAADLVKAVIRTELNAPVASEIRWKYLLDKEVDGKQETRQVVETKSGSLHRLIAIAGKPLSDAQQRDEIQRIQRLSYHPEEQRKLEQTRRKDAEQCNAFLRMIPDAFLFEYSGDSGSLVKIAFKPNPRFNPPSREAKVLHEMAGEIWVDAQQHRLVSIRGQLMNEVKFAGGLLGHLEKGGQFTVKRTEIVSGDWELTDMAINMQGKILLLKTISVQQKELHRNFERVPDDLNLPDAAGLLLKQSLVADKR